MNRWSVGVAWIVRLTVAGVFLWAGGQKARHPQLFALDLEAYRLLPTGLIVPIAYYVPWLEIMTALALFVPALRRAAIVMAMAMLVIFTLMLTVAWARGLQINCGCFGAAGHDATDFRIAVLRNLLLIGGSVWLTRHWSRQNALGSRQGFRT